jgi:hypothetical protein
VLVPDVCFAGTVAWFDIVFAFAPSPPQVEVYDVRMYVHSYGAEWGGTGRISEQQILDLSRMSTPEITGEVRPGRGIKCIEPFSSSYSDLAFVDQYGHSCDFYYALKQTNPTVCSLPKVKKACRLTCPSSHECFRTPVAPKTFYVWDRVRRVEAKGANGTICLSSMLGTRARAVEACENWLASSGGNGPPPADLEPWMSSAWGTGSQSRRIDLSDCEQVGEAIDEYCGFDSQAIKDFTASTVENGGDYTIAMWIRPLPLPDPTASLHSSGGFHPSIQFLSSISPPKPLLGLGLWANSDGEFRWYTTCRNASSRDAYENVETHAPDNDGWTFISISRTNSSWPASTKTEVFTNLRRFTEDAYAIQCLYNEEFMFEGLEINYPMLISPIMLIPEALPANVLQRMYLKGVNGFRVRTGELPPWDARLRH